jgi:hypothetical protein
MDIAFWRNLAIVWLSLFCLIGLAVPLVVLYFAVRGLQRVPGKVRPLLHKAQGYSQAMHQQSETLSTRVSEPLVRLHHRATHLLTAVRLVLPARQRLKP